MEKVLEINHLTKKYKRLVVNDLSFSVEKGNVYGLLGPNGSGKSTTLGMILTTINPTYGEWKWFNEEGTSTATLKKIGAIIEQPNFYPYLSAEKNLKIVAEIKGVSYSEIDRALEIVGLLTRKKDLFRTYSLGMKQRLAIASAMLNRPDVLILDEPTNGLDPEGIIQIREIIYSIAQQGTTIIIASHLLDEIEKICSHVIVLKNGNTIYSGPVDSMSPNKGYYQLQSENLEQMQKVLSETNFFSKLEIKNNYLIGYLYNNTYFELQSENLEQMQKTLSETKYFSKLDIRDNYLVGFLGNDISAASLNKYLAEKGIFLSHISYKKESLEDQFLELVKK